MTLFFNPDARLRKPREDYIYNPFIDNRKLASDVNSPYIKGRISRGKRIAELIAPMHLTRRMSDRMIKGDIDPGGIICSGWGLNGLTDVEDSDPLFTGDTPDFITGSRMYLRTGKNKNGAMVYDVHPPDNFFRELYNILPCVYQISFRYQYREEESDASGVSMLTRPVDIHSVFVRVIPFVTALLQMKKKINLKMLKSAEDAVAGCIKGQEPVGLWKPLRGADYTANGEEFGQLWIWMNMLFGVIHHCQDTATMMLIPALDSSEHLNSGKNQSTHRPFTVFRKKVPQFSREFKFSSWEQLLTLMFKDRAPEFLSLLASYTSARYLLHDRNMEDKQELQELCVFMDTAMEYVLGFLQMKYLLLFMDTHLDGGLNGALWNIDNRALDNMDPGVGYKHDFAMCIQNWLLHDSDIYYDVSEGVKDHRMEFPFPGMRCILKQEVKTGDWGCIDWYLDRYFRAREWDSYGQIFKLDREIIRKTLYLSNCLHGIKGVENWIRTGVPERYGGIRVKGHGSIRVAQLRLHSNLSSIERILGAP